MMTKTVPKFRLEYDAEFRERFGHECAEILRSDTLQEGPWVRRFERDFSSFIAAQHCTATSSGTTALEVALRAVGVAGKEVVLPTNTFIATAIAVERAGGIIRLVDIEPETYSADPDAIADAINENTGAVVLVHIGGVISKYVERIIHLCRDCHVPLVEDAAHAHGATRGDVRAGTIGQVAAFSFFPTKVMTCGEGGMVTTNDLAVAAKVRSIKDFGRGKRDGLLSYMPGMNAKMTEFQGLLGAMELERSRVRRYDRALLAAKYIDCLLEVGLFASVEPGSHYKMIVQTRHPAPAVQSFCEENGVSLSGGVYHVPLHQQPVYEGRWDQKLFPVSNHFSRHHVCLPLYPEMDVDDVKFVCDVLKRAEGEL